MTTRGPAGSQAVLKGDGCCCGLVRGRLMRQWRAATGRYGSALVGAQLLEKVLELCDLRLRPSLERFREHVDGGALHLPEALPGFGGQLDVDDATVFRAPCPRNQTGCLQLVQEPGDVARRNAESLREFLRGRPSFMNEHA